MNYDYRIIIILFFSNKATLKHLFYKLSRLYYLVLDIIYYLNHKINLRPIKTNNLVMVSILVNKLFVSHS